VHNLTPSVSLNSVTGINENGIATLNGSYTDIGLLDVHTLTVTWDDPNNALASTFTITAIQNAAGTLTLHVGDTFSSSTDSAVLTITSVDAATGNVGFYVQHQYLDDGLALGNGTISDTSTIGVTVADDDAQSGSNTTTVTVHNVTPSVSLNAVPDIDENGIATLTGSYTDIGLLDAHSITVNWNDPNNGAASTFSVTAIQNAAGAATLNVGDTFSSSTDGAILTITSIDPSTGQVGFSVQHQYLDDGPAPGNGTTSDTSTIGVTVLDDDTQSGSNTTTVTVHNVAPGIINLTQASIQEGHTATISFNVSDPGTLEVFTANVDWRDGSTAIIAALGALDATGTVGATTFVWTAATRELVLSHLYADNAEYPVIVRLADDDMASSVAVSTSPGNFAGSADPANFVQQTTLVSVANVPPFLAGTVSVSVNEGTQFTLASLGVHLEDIGFDNPLNETAPPFGDQFKETFTASTIDWGDGRGPIAVTIDNVAGRVSGSPGVNTVAQFIHNPYVYADDGTYTVTIKVADDNMGAFVDLTFKIEVKNVVPVLAAPVPSAISINEAQSVNFTVGFSDKGFDNPLNPNLPQPLIADPKTESFRYFIDWGDGRNQVGVAPPAPVADINGGVDINGVPFPSTGSFGATHNYADDGVYTVTIRLADDNMAAFNNTGQFAVPNLDGTAYVEQKFFVTVHNVAPSSVIPLNGDQVSPLGFTQIRMSFSDPGYDNPLNQTNPPNGDKFAESFSYLVNWGDGTTDTITVTNAGAVINGQTTVLSSTRVSGSQGVLTTGSFEVQHKYLGPPDPLNPTAPIPITVTLIDDNGGTLVQSITITNPGIETTNVAIDTTPDVPRLAFVPQQATQVLIDQTSAAPQGLQASNFQVGHSELAVTSDQYLELQVISPDGKVIGTYRLSDEALTDLRGLFATLPDSRYKIFLFRADNNSRRLVMDVFVRRGRVIDPSDDSEGTRDRPPTAEGTEQTGAQQDGSQQNAAPVEQAQPLNNNPLLQPLPGPNPPGAANVPNPPAGGVIELNGKKVATTTPSRLYAALPWAAPLAGLGLVASRESWSRRLGAALEQADERDWQRLRRAGRLGRTLRSERHKSAMKNKASLNKSQ